MRYFIELSYNGEAYHGWQNQPNAISVQEVVEDGLSELLKTKIEVAGAGRTDSGVHAEQMFAHFDYTNAIEVEELIYKLNSFLPETISVQNIFKVQSNVERIKSLYQEKNYHNIKVDYREKPLKQNQVDLEFIIEEGRKVYVESIRFIGNEAYSSKKLRNKMQTK